MVSRASLKRKIRKLDEKNARLRKQLAELRAKVRDLDRQTQYSIPACAWCGALYSRCDCCRY